MTCHASARTILPVSALLALCHTMWLAPATLAQPGAAEPGGPAPGARPAGGLLVPTADAAPGLILGGFASASPVAAGGLATLPVGWHLSVTLGGGLAADPPGLGGAAALRVHLRPTTVDRWGLALQARSMGGVVIFNGEDRAELAHALALVASSPVRPARIHLGVALHTMPGSEYEEGWDNPEDYDLDNPQVAAFAAAEHMGRHLGLFAEALWAGIGADDGWDSVLTAVVGARLRVGRTTVLEVGTGIFVERFGSGRANLLPFPPVVRASFWL